MKFTVFWDETPCILILLDESAVSILTVKEQAETLVQIDQSTGLHIA
jgi:hypothetical protein